MVYQVLCNNQWCGDFKSRALAKSFVDMQKRKTKGAGLAAHPHDLMSKTAAYAAKQKWTIMKKE